MWAIGYVAQNDTATTAISELGDAQPLGHHVVVRWWADKPETDSFAAKLPAIGDAQKAEVLGAHRRHKQTVVLLHELATTLGAIAEGNDASWIQHPQYGIKQSTFSDRNRELMQLALDARLAERRATTRSRTRCSRASRRPSGAAGSARRTTRSSRSCAASPTRRRRAGPRPTCRRRCTSSSIACARCASAAPPRPTRRRAAATSIRRSPSSTTCSPRTRQTRRCTSLGKCEMMIDKAGPKDGAGARRAPA